MGDRDYETDLIVIGAGLAGLVAANVAAEQGLHVFLLEKQSNTGGSLQALTCKTV